MSTPSFTCRVACCRPALFVSARSAALGLLLAAGTSISAASAHAQFTDACASAPTVAEGLFTFDLTSATPGDQPFTPQCTNGRPATIDQWIRYVPSASGPVAFSTQGLTTGDTVISLHDTFSPEFDCAFAPFQVRACNDDAGGPQSRVVLNAIAGQAVLVRVAGGDDTRPVGSLRIEAFEPTPGDTCTTAPQAFPGVNSYDTTSAVLNSFEGCFGDRDVFFTYTPAVNGALTISTCGQPTRADVTIFEGCGGPRIACTTFEGCSVGVGVQAGVPLIIRLANGQSTGVESFVLDFNPSNLPANDNCADATGVELGQTPFDNTFALNGQPLQCGGGFFPFQGGRDLWYFFTPIESGTYDISTADSEGISDTILGLYDSCEGFAFACDNDSRGFRSWIRAPLTGGQTYFIQILGAGRPDAGIPFDSGAGVLSIVRSIAPSNDACESALTVAAGTHAYDVYDATQSPQPFGCLPRFNSPGNDVWFRYVPTSNGPVEASLLQGGAAGSVSIFTSCEGAIAANADYLFDIPNYYLQPRAVAQGQSGVPLLVRVASTRFNEDPLPPTGTGEVYIGALLVPTLPNDVCANAIPVTEGETAINLVGSAKDCAFLNPDPADTCAPPTDNDLFYRYTPGESGTVSITIADGIDYPFYDGLVVSVYDGCGGPPLACSLALGDAPLASLAFDATAGVPYTIRVASILAFGIEQVRIGTITIGAGPSACEYDFNQDENVDLTDAQQMAQVAAGVIVADPTWLDGDVNGDENADLTDAQILAAFVATNVCGV